MESRLFLVIIIASAAMLSGCMGAAPEAATTTTLETTTTSTLTSTTLTVTTTTSTTTSETSSTTLFKVACLSNADCGNYTEQRICNQGNVYSNTITPICNSPGTPYAKCMAKSALSRSPVEVCLESQCRDGVCVHKN